jgi:hypothetical protein
MNGFLNFRSFGKGSSRLAAALLFGGILFFSFLTSCEKDTSPSTGKEGDLPESGTLIPSCSDPLAANTVLGLIRTPDDPNNDRLNMMLYHYAKAIRVVAQNPTHLCYMETPMIADVGTIGVSLYTLAQNNASFAQALNAALRQSMSENNIYPKGDVQGIETSIADANWDANAFLRGKMERPPYAYEPIIYFVKRPTTCESNKLPTVVIAQDVNDCDDVAGWRGSDEVLVSENEAKTSTEPIIFVGPGLGTYKTDGYTGGVNEVILTKPNINEEGVFLNDEIGVSERADVGIDADLYQIKAGFRYESSKRSEIQGWLVTFAPFTPSIYVLNNWEDFNAKKIHKDDINDSKLFTEDANAFTIAMASFDAGRSIFYGTFEYDWWTSNKFISNSCSSTPASQSVYAKMKFSNEWYFFNCGVASAIFPSVGSTWEVNNNKCRFLLKR